MTTLRVARTLVILLALAALAALPIALASPFQVIVLTVDLGPLGPAEFGVVGSLITSFLLVLVTGIGAVVASYAARNLTGQHRLGRFGALELTAVLALGCAVVAPSLVQLALGWTIGGLAVAGLVGHAGSDAARRPSRIMATRLLVGDLALWGAVLISGTALGTLQLASLGSAVAASSTWTVALTALLVAIAGIARSALFPMHRWLPETAEAPSPVSAMLHAGLVNGVGVLALLLWPLFMASVAVRGVILVVALVTAVLGTAQVRTRPDVKGRLAGSTSAQMGYLGVEVALGLPAAVLAHLIGHGLWKASLFLGAGGAVERARSAVVHPQPRGPLRVLRLVTLAAAVVATSSTIPGPWGAPLVPGPASLLPALIAALALAMAYLGAWRLHTRAHALVLTASTAAVVIYVLALRALTSATDADLEPATPRWGAPGMWAVATLVIAVVAIGIAFWAIDSVARAGRARWFVDAVARTSLPPRTIRQMASRTPALDASLVKAAAVAPTAAEVNHARAVVHEASEVIAPLWPLESFVASNPLASLESLDFDEALRVAADIWGSPTGPSSKLLRDAVVAGRVDDAAITRAWNDLAAVDDRAPLNPPDLNVVRELHFSTSGSDVSRARATTSAYVQFTYGRVFGAAAWPTTPGGAWAAVRADAGLDSAWRVRGVRELVLALPPRADQAVAVLLRLLQIPESTQVREVERLLASNVGWAAHVAWRLRQGVPVPSVTSTASADQSIEAYADLVVLQLLDRVINSHDSMSAESTTSRSRTRDATPSALELTSAGTPAEPAASVRELHEVGLNMLRLEAWEHAIHDPIAHSIATRARDLAEVGLISSTWHQPGGPDAQFVTCIDVRSERLRRHLEQAGPWETLGAAGFFGLPLRHVSPTGVITERCPVLIRPDNTVVERAQPTRWMWSTTEGGEALHEVEGRPFTPYALAEAAGWLLGPLAALRTAAPAWWSTVSGRARATLGAPTHGVLVTAREGDAAGNTSGDVSGDVGFAVTELIDLADGFLRSTGLVELAPLVVLCGHGGAAANNPHLAAYDCGACGGQAGDVSARAMVQALSDQRVRAGLLERGIDITQTTFVAALHDTTRDRVTVLDVEVEPSSTMAHLVADLSVATDALARERQSSLPQAPSATSTTRLRHHLDRRATDWAQVRPEWGLAGNAAMVIGPRSLTAGFDLGGRVFLQSYRPDVDPDGVLLESLLAGPLVVGQWINLQYWCSTIDPNRFGAGDKTTHNVVVGADGTEHALSGVLTGVRGDLRIGLPWQAVSPTAPIAGRWTGVPHHDPVRLLAVVCARPEVVDAVLDRQPHVAQLVRGGWIKLQVVDPETGELLRLHRERGWLLEDVEDSSLVLDAETGA